MLYICLLGSMIGVLRWVLMVMLVLGNLLCVIRGVVFVISLGMWFLMICW